MKKVISVIAALMVIMTNCAAFAYSDEYEKAYNDIEEFLEQMDWTEYYNDSVDDWGVYGCIGLLSIDGTEKACQLNADWNDVGSWFKNWYESELMAHYPEFGELSVDMSRAGENNGTEIWHITVAAMNDLVSYVDGEQNIVDMMVAFY